jgi:hypothetical protein
MAVCSPLARVLQALCEQAQPVLTARFQKLATFGVFLPRDDAITTTDLQLPPDAELVALVEKTHRREGVDPQNERRRC